MSKAITPEQAIKRLKEARIVLRSNNRHEVAFDLDDIITYFEEQEGETKGPIGQWKFYVTNTAVEETGDNLTTAFLENTKTGASITVATGDDDEDEYLLHQIEKVLNAAAPVEVSEELWQTANPNEPKYAMSSNLDTKGMPVQWIDLWCEIENWYGDAMKRETAEQFLTRLQGKLTLRSRAGRNSGEGK